MKSLELTSRQQFWLDHYNSCQKEQLSFQAYCAANNLSDGAFGHARKVLAKKGVIKNARSRQKTPAVSFVEVKAATPVIPSTAAFATLVLPNQVRIEVPMSVLIRAIPSLLGGDDDTAR